MPGGFCILGNYADEPSIPWKKYFQQCEHSLSPVTDAYPIILCYKPMTQIHFRRLMRIAIVIVALALLFNFFAYYLLYIRSKENETLVEEVGLSGNQLNLVQRISEETILLLNSHLKESESFSIRQNLENTIQQLDKQNKSLFKAVTLSDTSG